MGATPFLNDLAHYEGIAERDVRSLRYFISGGAPIPAALVRTATARIGCKVIAIWGMTEVSAVTTVLPDNPPERACESDGIAMPHSEVQVVDDAGNELPRSTAPMAVTLRTESSPLKRTFGHAQSMTLNRRLPPSGGP